MRKFSSLYLIDPLWQGDENDIEQRVINEFPHAHGFLEAAPELWRIAGRSDLAQAIRAVSARAYADQEYPELSLVDIDNLLALLQGIEDAIVGRIVDKKEWALSDNKLEELRKEKFSYINLADNGVHIGRYGVAIALGNLGSLRNILLDARQRNLHIALPI